MYDVQLLHEAILQDTDVLFSGFLYKIAKSLRGRVLLVTWALATYCVVVLRSIRRNLKNFMAVVST